MTDTTISVPVNISCRIERLAKEAGRPPMQMLKFVIRDSPELTEYSVRVANAGLAELDAGISPVSVNAVRPVIKPSLDSPLIKALGRCYYWQHLLDTGMVEDTVEIAKREGLSKVTVNETLRLVSLAPDIAEAILRGTLPRRVSRQLLVRITLPPDWDKQAELIAGFG